jgi:glycosyl transferase family 1
VPVSIAVESMTGSEMPTAIAEPTQASVVALLLELADLAPRSFDAHLSADEQRFPWSWSALPGQDGEPEPALASAPFPNIAYVLPGLPPEGSGGSHSLVQEARGLRELGAEARICVPLDSLSTAAALYGNKDQLFATYRSDAAYPGVSDSSLLEAIAGADVVVATEYPSVELLAWLARERPEVVYAYYVQDYEPLFAAPRTERSDRALLSYRAIPGQLLFAKTHWLRNVVSEMHGVPVAKVRPSLDRELFHERGRLDYAGVLRVAAMVRPRTPRRRPAATLEALAAIARAVGDAVSLVTFGCDEHSFGEVGGHGVAGVHHLGPLSRREVSELMRRSDVFIDASAYQAFGRTGLEAMACGAVPLLPALGGVREYAVHDENALILADGSPAAIADTVVALALDPARVAAMSAAGVARARSFSVERAARSQLELFSAVVHRRRSSSALPAS